MWICNDCGAVFEEPRQTHNGGTYDEPWTECPVCGGGYERAELCDICGCWKHPDDMASKHCCDGCAERERTVENALRFLKDCKKEKDFFVDWLFDSTTVNASVALIYLCKSVWKAMGEHGQAELRDFISENKEEFAEWLECL